MSELEYAGATQRVEPKRSLRWLWILLLGLASFGVILWSVQVHRTNAAIDAACKAITAAKTPADENDAFFLTKSTTHGYTVQLYDAGGAAIVGATAPVASLTITWENGRSVSAPLHDVKNVAIFNRD